MKPYKHIIVALAIGSLAVLSSCSVPKNITYMQGFENGQTEAVRGQTRLTIQPDDKMSIVVSCKDPQLAEVFNLSVPQFRVGYGISNFNNSQYTAAFTVDPDGCIDYPILGRIHVSGMTRAELSATIKSKIVAGDYIKDPVVTVEFMNATIAVLGDVARPGEYKMENDNMTVLQAISKAGDLTITGMRDNVLVVREENGKDIAYRLNLTDTKSLLESPAYYLQQNDVVYIEPNSTKKRQSTTTGNTVLTPTFWISVASLLTTITAVFLR